VEILTSGVNIARNPSTLIALGTNSKKRDRRGVVPPSQWSARGFFWVRALNNRRSENDVKG
jgi:hypothetical protein